MFAPRRTSAVRGGAPLLAGLAVGAVLIGAAALVTPEESTDPAILAALGAPLPPVTAPAPAAVPRPTTPVRPQLTVPAPVTTTPPAPAPTPAPVEPPPVEEEVPPPATTPAPPSSTSQPEPDPTVPARPRVAVDPVGGVVEATNAARAEAGCGDLRVDLRLAASAQGHAEDMSDNDYFSHTSQDGREFDDRIRAQGHPSPGGENIAAGQETADEVVAAWMESPGHRRNILDCSFTSIGVGYDPDGDHWVQNFGR